MSADRLKLDVALEKLPLRAPFRISGYTFTDVPVLLVTLEQHGLRGRGEATGVYYFNDDPPAMKESIEAKRDAIEGGVTREELRQLLPIGGARNAVDCALWDLEAKRAAQPVWRLAGLSQVKAPITTFTLGADDPPSMARGAREYAHARALKLKLSGDPAIDIERLKAVRAARPDVWLGVDANQGYTHATLSLLIPALVDAGVQLLEQPLPRSCDADMEDLHCPVPLAADESVQGLAEVEPLVGRFDVVNIKLDKCGGLTEALLMVAEARRLGFKPMVGNMVGTSLAMAPAFVVAQLCDFVDLDGPTFLLTDRAPTVSYHDGRIWCPEEVWGAAVDR